jgi:hypothetical protein
MNKFVANTFSVILSFMHVAVIILLSVDLVTESAQADNFDSYNNRTQMQCIAENGIIQFSVEGEVVTIAGGNDLPMSGKVDGNVIKKNSDKEQYIINLGFVEYFFDFENQTAVANIMGMKYDLQCF